MSFHGHIEYLKILYLVLRGNILSMLAYEDAVNVHLCSQVHAQWQSDNAHLWRRDDNLFMLTCAGVVQLTTHRLCVCSSFLRAHAAAKLRYSSLPRLRSISEAPSIQHLHVPFFSTRSFTHKQEKHILAEKLHTSDDSILILILGIVILVKAWSVEIEIWSGVIAI